MPRGVWRRFGTPNISAGYNAYLCKGFEQEWMWTLEPFPGDGFADNVAAATGPLRVDQTKGVTLEQAGAYAPPGTFWQPDNTPLSFSDSVGAVIGLQWDAPTNTAIQGHEVSGPGGGHIGGVQISHNLFNCGAGPGCINVDTNESIDNYIIVSTTTTAGSYCIKTGYPSTVFHNTCIGANATNGTFFQNAAPGAGLFQVNSPLFPAPISDNVFFGFPNCYAVGYSPLGVNSEHNATDLASCPSGGTFTPSIGGGTMTTVGLSGLTGQTPSANLANPTPGAGFDARVLSASAPIYGGASALAFFTNSSFGAGILGLGPDVLNNARPTSGRFDIGAEQFIPSTALPSGGPRRILRR